MKRNITLRAAIIIIFVVAVVSSISSHTLLGRRKKYLQEAVYHHGRILEETKNISDLDKCRGQATPPMSARALAKLDKSCRLRIVYHAELEKRYRFTANRPWQGIGFIAKDPGEDLLWEAFSDNPLD